MTLYYMRIASCVVSVQIDHYFPASTANIYGIFVAEMNMREMNG